MRKTFFLLGVLLVLLLVGCEHDSSGVVEKETPIVAEPGAEQDEFQEVDRRLVQGYLVEDQIWAILRDFSYTGTSSIIRYQLTDGTHELNVDSPHQIINGDELELGMKPEIAVKDNHISFRGDDAAALFDMDAQEQVFQYKKVGRTLPARSFSTLCEVYIDVDVLDHTICVRNAINHELIQESRYGEESLQFFTWYQDDVKFAYLAGQSEINIVTMTEDEVQVIPLWGPFWEYEPENLVDYTNLFWSADGTHVILEALCEYGAVLQVISLDAGEVVYEYNLEDDGTLLGVTYGSQLLILDDAENRKLMRCNYRTGDEKSLVQTDQYIHFVMLSRYENKLIYDLYDPKTKKQTIQIMQMKITLSSDVIEELLKETIDERTKLTFYPKRNETIVYNDDGSVSIVFGYTLNNNYYHGVFKVCDMNDITQWEYVTSELILEDVQYYIDLASEAYIRGFHEKEYGDNLIETRVGLSDFEGGDSTRYEVFINHEFKVEKDYVVMAAGNIRQIDEEGWYSGNSYIIMVKSDDGYKLESFATSP